MSSTFDRSKYRAPALNTVQKTVEDTKKFNTFFGGNSDYAGFFPNEEGSFVKRILPAHTPGDSPYVPMKTAQLEVEVDKKDDDGKVIGKEIKRKKIFIATLHGGAKHDIIEEYIKRVYELAEQYQGKEKDKFLAPVTGYRMGNGKWVWGIRPQLEYICYISVDGKIYRDSLNQKQMELLNRKSADLCKQNDTAAIDMFSDPTNGFPILWSRVKDEKGKRVDTWDVLPPKMNQSWEDFYAEHAVSDKTLQELEEYASLKSLYVNSYTKKDFDYALDGLKRFDEANGYGIFGQEDYLDIVEEVSNWADELENKGISKEDDELPFEETKEKPVQQKTVSKPATKKVVATKKKAEITDAEKLKIVNEEFIAQYGDEYEELELEGEELEQAYKLAIAHEDLGYDIPHVPGWGEQPEETPEPEPEPKVEEKPVVNVPKDANSSSGRAAVERIRAMREKRQNSQS